MMRCLAVLSLLPMVAGPAVASCYNGYPYPVYKKVYTPYFIPVAKYFDVPLYTAAYVPPIGTTTTTQTTTTQTTTAATTTASATTTVEQQRAVREDQFRATVVGELRGLRTRMDRIEGKHVLPMPKGQKREGPPEKGRAPEKSPTAADGLIVVQNKCSACHRQDTAEKDGDGFVMFDAKGEPVSLTAEQMVTTIRMIDRSKMPKIPNNKGITALTDIEATAITAWLHEQKMKVENGKSGKKDDEQIPHRPEYVSIKKQAKTPTVRFRRIKR